VTEALVERYSIVRADLERLGRRDRAARCR